jgi:hypothetical protein
MKVILTLCLVLATFCATGQARWSAEKAKAWYQKQPWLVGCNFIPSTAINQLEMWQADTFDPATIDRELALAQGIGFNVVRVYLHSLAWQADKKGFKQRMNTFLRLADRRQIKTLFVLFDDCWNDDPKQGKQPAPKPGVHNSGWVQCPAYANVIDSTTWAKLELEAFTKDVLRSFAKDKRILLWDLYNEPGNSGLKEKSLPLLKKVFAWAKAANPQQPISVGLWFDNAVLNEFQRQNSDVITFHNYSNAASMEQQILDLQQLGRPLICTEYMARTNDSQFATHLPILKKYQVGAINWGLVSGKSNTIFPWGSKAGSPEPAIWFHDIFRANGTAFAPQEVETIRSITKK